MSFEPIAASPQTRAAYRVRIALPVALLLMVVGWIAYIVIPTGGGTTPSPANDIASHPGQTGAGSKNVGNEFTAADPSPVHP